MKNNDGTNAKDIYYEAKVCNSETLNGYDYGSIHLCSPTDKLMLN